MNEAEAMAQEIAAERSGYVEHSRSAFRAGWDAAMERLRTIAATPGGDGCFCSHHPDDPAHTEDCYDLVKYFFDR